MEHTSEVTTVVHQDTKNTALQSMKTILSLSSICLFLLSVESLFASDFPYEILLKEKTDFPIITNGRIIGTIAASNGTTVAALFTNNAGVEVQWKNYTTTLSIDKTNLKDVIEVEEKDKALKKAKREEERQKELILVASRQKEEHLEKQQKTLKVAEHNVRVLNKYIHTYPKEEQEPLNRVLIISKDFIDKFNNSDVDQRDLLVAAVNQKYNELIKSRPVYALKYNEFIHRDLVTPVDFNIYKNNDGLYLAVGDGDFSTIADINPADFGQIITTGSTVMRWADKCIDEKLNTEKELYKSQSIRIEFVSQDEGDNQFIRLSVRGPLSKNSLLASQDVVMTKNSYYALIFKMSKAEDMLRNRIQIQNNAEKLQ